MDQKQEQLGEKDSGGEIKGDKKEAGPGYNQANQSGGLTDQGGNWHLFLQ